MSKPNSLYLQEPTPLPELDEWVNQRKLNSNRFTFLEETILKPLWQEGQELRLREDRRFQPYKDTLHWHLEHEKIANELLYDKLLEEEGDEQNLEIYLLNLDKAINSSWVHIFYPDDERFKLTKLNSESFNLSLAIDSIELTLSDEQQHLLNQLLDSLLNNEQIWSIEQIQTKLSEFDNSLNFSPLEIEKWLLSQTQLARVAIDKWEKRELLPATVKIPRYAIISAAGTKLPFIEKEPEAETPIISVSNSPSKVGEAEDTIPDKISWKIVLRTVHLNEGVLSVPVHARQLYPRAKGLAKMLAFTVLWFEDGNEFTIWLDCSKHKLFGDELVERLQFLNLGTILQISWSKNGLVFALVGEDLSIADEEVRLVDEESLKSSHVESYRASLRKLLADSPSNFKDLYRKLCTFQQHKINTNTVRSILSGSSEFIYERTTNLWQLNQLLTKTDSDKEWQTIVKAQGVSASSPKLADLISEKRQKLANLRKQLL